MGKVRFLSYIHNLRGFAMIFIVGAHCKGYSQDWIDTVWVYPILVSIFENSTIVFVFISGFLFQYLFSLGFNFSEYLRKKFFYVFLPYIVVSIPIIALKISGVSNLPSPMGIDELTPIGKIGIYLLTGQHLLPYWFMPMIFIFYLIAPLLHRLDNTSFFKYVFPVIFALGLFTFRPLNYANPLLSFLHFLPIYLLGMAGGRYHDQITRLNLNVIISLSLIYVGINLLEWIDIITLSRKYTFEQVLEGEPAFNIYKLKLSILCIVLLNVFYRARNVSSKTLKLLGTYSFGIYFVHHYFISFGRFGLRYLDWDMKFNFPGFMVYLTLIIALSIVAVHLIKKVFGKYSRMVIGS